LIRSRKRQARARARPGWFVRAAFPEIESITFPPPGLRGDWRPPPGGPAPVSVLDLDGIMPRGPWSPLVRGTLPGPA